MASTRPIRTFGIQYGPHQRNKLDLWQPFSRQPTPLVIFYHGGGFQIGDKAQVRHDAQLTTELRGFLQAGIAFAAVSYRCRHQFGKGTGAYGSMCDCRLALQYLRSEADAYNFDKGRIGAFGHSAGGGTSLWLAFHNDMRELSNPDPILRESTRLTVVGARSVQATYNPSRWPDILHVDPATVGVEERQRTFWQLDPNDDQVLIAGKEVDFLAQMSSGDPPMYVSNTGIDGFDDDNEVAHHPLHAVALWERAKELGIESRVYAPTIGLTAPCEDLVDFFLWHLLKYPELCFGFGAGTASEVDSELNPV